MGNHDTVQYQPEAHCHHTKSIRKRYECSIGTGSYWRMVSHISWSSSGVSALPNLLNIFLEDIMAHALDNFNGTILWHTPYTEKYNDTISIGGRKIKNLRFADDIDCITGEEDEQTKLVQNLETAATKFGMEINAEKSKVMTHNGTLQRNITVQGQKLETVDHYKWDKVGRPIIKVIIQVTVEGKRKKGRPKNKWTDNIAEWTGKSFAETQDMAHNRQEWRELTRKYIMTRPYTAHTNR